MTELFEYEGRKFSSDYGLYLIDSEGKEESFNYGGWIELQHPDKKWFYNQGGSYQGEWVALGVSNDGFFFHQGSYGSCSGCDWLEGLSDKEDAINFLNEMKKIIKIGDTWEEAKVYLENTKKNGWEDLVEAIDFTIKEYESCQQKQEKNG